jgi:DNA-binding winged helix-turn-helix (wHTH) protein
VDARISPDVVHFGQFRLDRRAGRLLRSADGGQFEQVSLGSRAIGVLCTLIERDGDLVSKDEIMAAGWPDAVVEDSNLTVQISALRRVLDQGRLEGSWIQTVPGRGYRFVPLPAQPEVALIEPVAHRQSDGPALPRRRRVGAVAAVAVASTALLAAGGWWTLRGGTGLPDASQDRRQSLIIRPFEGSGGAATADSVAAEITRELTDLIVLGGEGPVVTLGAYQGEPRGCARGRAPAGCAFRADRPCTASGRASDRRGAHL